MIDRFRCWWSGFVGTWLDPRMGWAGITFDGHVYDLERPRYFIEGGLEHEFLSCDRCGREMYQGWRRAV